MLLDTIALLKYSRLSSIRWAHSFTLVYEEGYIVQSINKQTYEILMYNSGLY